MAAVSELLFGEITTENILRLHAVFEIDLLLPSAPLFGQSSEQLFSRLRQEGVLVRATHGFRFADRHNGPFFPGMLLSSLQSYLWLSSTLQKMATPDETIGVSTLVDELLRGFKAASYLGGVSRTEAAARTSLLGVVDSLESRGFIEVKERSAQSKEITLSRSLHEEVNLLQNANDVIERWLQNESRLLNFGVQVEEHASHCCIRLVAAHTMSGNTQERWTAATS